MPQEDTPRPDTGATLATTFERGTDHANETCLSCGKHISRHYGLDEYRCVPRPIAPAVMATVRVGSSAGATTRVLMDVESERSYQRGRWGNDHDDGEHATGGALIVRAAELLVTGTDEELTTSAHERDSWGLVAKHGSTRRGLIVAIALAVAHVETLDRLREGGGS